MVLITWLNRIAGALLDGLIWPVRGQPPLWGLLVVSAATAVPVLLAFRYTSNQAGIARAKARVQAQLLRVLLFRHDLSVMLRAERDLILCNIAYVRLALLSLCAVIGPLVLLVAHLDARYGHAPLAVGEGAVVTVRVREASQASQDWHLRAPAGVRVESPAVRAPAIGEVSWRIRPTAAGRHVLSVETSGAAWSKVVHVGGGGRPAAVSPRRVSGLLALLSPAEPPLQGGRIAREIEVTYPTAHVRVGPWRVHWVVVFLAATLLFGYALRGPLRAEV